MMMFPVPGPLGRAGMGRAYGPLRTRDSYRLNGEVVLNFKSTGCPVNPGHAVDQSP